MNIRDFHAARLAMVESQLRTNQVSDPDVLAAFAAVPREEFVSESLKGVAYVDDDLPEGKGRYLIEPMVLARLVQAAAVAPQERVLALGDPTGYAAAILARLTRGVTMLESDPGAAATARKRLATFGAGHAKVVEGPLERGWAAGAPYDAIVVAGAVERVPTALGAQLAEGGRLVCVLRARGRTMGEGSIAVRMDGLLSHRALFDAGTPFLPDFVPAADFAF
jgi:protein-L-isoaspartate(D-aspartate) O-methyltransferase